jgi:hypothetical protein
MAQQNCGFLRERQRNPPSQHLRRHKDTRVKSIINTTRSPENAFQAIDPIRVEMLSTEMPVHQLSKRGEEEIRIIRRAPKGGQVSVYWKVEPNLAVGHPGQLAYRLDTWVIKRRLDQLPRPIPRLIRVGDLRQIARELDHGGDTNAVKRAFEQNASAFIRAKIAYRARDGREETFEGYFNRYNVFFRGQSLPGGTHAETVYISLNDPYHALINGSIWRPLDYQYLRALTPAAQRLYELLSPKIFATIKNDHPAAWIHYSDFCALAVAKRQGTKQRMQSQMAAVHRPHLASGYFSAISWRAERGTDGTPDWTIHYVPGPRAMAEFEAFNGASRRPHKLAIRSVRAVRPYLTVKRSMPKPMAAVQEDSPATMLARRFAQRRGGSGADQVTPTQVSKAAEILDALEGDIESAISAVDLAAAEGKRNPKGFPKYLGGVLQGGFIERGRMTQAEQRRRAEGDRRQREQADLARYGLWCDRRATERVAGLSPNDCARLIDERLPKFVEEHQYFVRQLDLRGESVSAWAEPRILKRYGHEGEPPFEEWRRLHNAQPTDSSGPHEALQ